MSLTTINYEHFAWLLLAVNSLVAGALSVRLVKLAASTAKAGRDAAGVADELLGVRGGPWLTTTPVALGASTAAALIARLAGGRAGRRDAVRQMLVDAAHGCPDALSYRVESFVDRVYGGHNLRRLAGAARLAVLAGLLGTALGLLSHFVHRGRGTPDAGSIGLALGTTVVGIFISWVAVAVSTFVGEPALRRIVDVYLAAAWRVHEHVRGGGGGGGGSGSAPADRRATGPASLVHDRRLNGGDGLARDAGVHVEPDPEGDGAASRATGGVNESRPGSVSETAQREYDLRPIPAADATNEYAPSQRHRPRRQQPADLIVPQRHSRHPCGPHSAHSAHSTHPALAPRGGGGVGRSE